MSKEKKEKTTQLHGKETWQNVLPKTGLSAQEEASYLVWKGRRRDKTWLPKEQPGDMNSCIMGKRRVGFLAGISYHCHKMLQNGDYNRAMSRTPNTRTGSAQLGWDGAEKKRSDCVSPKPAKHYPAGPARLMFLTSSPGLFPGRCTGLCVCCSRVRAPESRGC